MKSKLILITVLALGSIAHAQGFVSHLSAGAGMQGVFASSTFSQSALFQPSTTQTTTNSVGVVGDLRLDFGHHSAMDLSVTFNRNSEISTFVSNQAPLGQRYRVQTDNAEIIGSYIYRFHSIAHVKPYALAGGGMVRFNPIDETTPDFPQNQSKPAFAYGGGADFPISEHLALRLQYRGLLRTSPDFSLQASDHFGTQAKAHVIEPSVQIVYHF